MPLFTLRDGAHLNYEKTGHGPALFLVPGLGGDGRFWQPQLAELARHFTVVVHDHRGTGSSSPRASTIQSSRWPMMPRN